MSLPTRQFEALTADRVLEALQSGRMPSLGEIQTALNEVVLRERRGLPLMRLRPQGRKVQWDVASFNKVLEEFDFDMSLLYEELLDLGSRLLKRHNFQTVSYRSQSRQLDTLLGNLNSLLFTLRSSDDRFFGLWDNYQDLSKVDLDLTTKNAIDLEEAAAVLPAGVSSARKLEMIHLYDRTIWGVKPIVIEGVRVLSNKPGIDAPFGNAFHDLVNVWRQDIYTDASGPVTIEFTIPISSIEDQSVSITRVQLVPHISQEMTVRVLYSNDGANYLALPARPEVVMKRGDKVINLDIPSTRLRYVRFQITSNTPDEIISSSRYRYSFGFQHIGFYTIGRLQDAEVVSVHQRPANMTKPISKVALTVSETIPAECNLEYFVASADADGNRTSPWQQLSPLGRQSAEAPTEIKFSNSNLAKRIVRADRAEVYTTRKNHSYYTLDPDNLITDDILFGSCALLRGKNAWVKNTKQERILRTVNDAFINFREHNTRPLYAVIREVAVASSGAHPNRVQDPPVTRLEVTHDIDYEYDTMDVIPDEGIDVTADQTPNYSIYSVKRFRQNAQASESVVLTAFQDVALTQPNAILTGVDEPEVTNIAGTIVYIKDVDYKLTLDLEGGAQIRRSEGTNSAITSGQTVIVNYSLDSDITRLVDTIKDNQVILSKDIPLEPGERFEVTYRFTPKDPNTIVKNTVHVTERYGQNKGKVYRDGTDYYVDIANGLITRVSQGEIAGSGVDNQIAAYVDFKYVETPKSLSTFSTWVFVENAQPVSFEFSNLELDLTRGEQVLIVSGPDVKDISNETSSPELARGWHQIVVKSKDPDTFTDAAIKKISALIDIDSNPVFIAGGRYFTRMTAFLQPMRQVTLEFLKAGALPSDHTIFAVDSGNVVVSFQPGGEDDLFLYGARLDPETNAVTTGIWPEEFEIEYNYQLDNATLVEYLMFRTVLSRKSTADNGLTPKLFEWHLRCG